MEAVSVQVAQVSACGHDVGHEGGVEPVSHVSEGISTTPLPQVAGQSESTAAWAPGGQQPSPPRNAVVGTNRHRALHVLPSMRRSSVQGIPSAQVVGQAPTPLAIAVSQVSPASNLPLPQVAEQSGSVARVQSVGQQPSDVGEQALTGLSTQATVQSVNDPCIT